MLGAIIGDIVGSRFEWHNIKSIHHAISIGGDSDTIAIITGSMAEAFYRFPAEIRSQAIQYSCDAQIGILNRFEVKYGTVREKETEKDTL